MSYRIDIKGEAYLTLPASTLTIKPGYRYTIKLKDGSQHSGKYERLEIRKEPGNFDKITIGGTAWPLVDIDQMEPDRTSLPAPALTEFVEYIIKSLFLFDDLEAVISADGTFWSQEKGTYNYEVDCVALKVPLDADAWKGDPLLDRQEPEEGEAYRPRTEDPKILEEARGRLFDQFRDQLLFCGVHVYEPLTNL